jgi:hypothetical protein
MDRHLRHGGAHITAFCAPTITALVRRRRRSPLATKVLAVRSAFV